MPADIDAIAEEVLRTLGTRRQIAPFTSRSDGLDVDESYRALAALNRKLEARGEIRRGRKIGFTNRTIWQQYKVYAPIWGYIYQSTLHDLATTASLALTQFAEPRIEPEIVVRSCACAVDGDGRGRAALLCGMGRAWIRDRAVDLSALAILCCRHRGGKRTPWRTFDRAASRDRSACRAMAKLAAQFCDRSSLRPPPRRSRTLYQRARRPLIGVAPSRPPFGARPRQPAACGGRDRDNRNAHARHANRGGAELEHGA